MLARLGLVLGGVLAGLVCLLVMEGVLWLVGAGGGPPAYDPFSGFSAAVPLFEGTERADGTPIYRVSPARLVNSPDADRGPEREFLARKPAHGFRAFVVGGSSAAGFPYPPAYGFSSWLERRLAARFPDMQIEIVNAAVAGYSSRRVLIVVRELAAYEPDLVIVYSGHNEWAERRYYSSLIDMHPWLFALRERLMTSRVFNLLSHLVVRSARPPEEALERFIEDQQNEFQEMFAVFSRRAEGHDYANPEEIEQRDRLYRANLDEIARAAEAAGARVMFLSLSQNFADWAPGASGHRPGLDDAERSEWDALVAQGTRAAQQGDCRRAAGLFERALGIDDAYADLHFRLAECRRALGEFEAARRHYRQASDLDRIPHGAPTYFNDTVRAVAEERDAIFVDAAGALEAASPNGLVGDDLFVEFAHPNLRAQQVIAAEIESAMRAAGLPRPAEAWPELDWPETPIDVLVAADPSLRIREHESIRFVCAIARRPGCAAEQKKIIDALRADSPP